MNKKSMVYNLWPIVGSLILLQFFLPLISYSTQTLDFDEVTEKALQNAYDVKLSGLDIHISQSMRKRAYSLYYPTLNARWNSEYVKDLTDGTAQVTAVGNTVLVQNTMYQNYFSIAANYNLYGFGATGDKVLIAEKDVDVKKTVFRQSVRDIKLKILNIYKDLLLGSREIESKMELLSLYKELALAKERLYAAGMISRIEMADEAIKVVKIVDAIENLKLKISTALKDLSFYTGETYIVNDIKLTDFKGYEADYEDSFDPEKSPESRIYDLEIEKKNAELEILKKERFPQFGLYSNYVWYGNNLNEYDASLRYAKPRNFFVGLSATMPLFEGFKTSAEIEKARLEIDRLKLEKKKRLAELSSRHAKLSEAKLIYDKGVEMQKDMLTKTEAKLSMAERLATQKIIELAEFLNHRIVLASQRFELTRTIITKISTLKELKIFSEAAN